MDKNIQSFLNLSVEFRERLIELKSLYNCYKKLADNFLNIGLIDVAYYWQNKVNCIYDVLSVLGLENIVKE